MIFLRILKHLALNVFKNLVFLKVQSRNFDRGLSFRSAGRSNTIEVTQNASHVSKTCVFHWVLVHVSPPAPKMYVFLVLFI